MTYEEQGLTKADYEKYVQQARREYTSDDVEIDDSPAVSAGDDGIWVAAWVWVYSGEIADVEPGQDEEES